MARKIQKKKNLILRKKLETIVWFLIKFNILAIPLYLVMYLNFTLPPLQTFLATLSSYGINLFGYHLTQDEMFLYSGSQQIEISWDSTGWKSMYALAALVIATPVSDLHKKIRFLFIGVPLVFLINYLRITSTILVSLKFGFQYFDIIHMFLWREGLILAVVAIWYVWLRKKRYNIR